VQQVRLSDSLVLIKIRIGPHVHSLSWQRRGQVNRQGQWQQSNGAASEDAICSCSVSSEPNAWRGKRSLQLHLGTVISQRNLDVSRGDKAKNQCHNYVRQLILFHPSLCQWSPTPLPLPLPVDLPLPLPGERMDVRTSVNLDESGTIG
jgi:hypothetical protein